MGFRFRKSISFGKGVRVNLGKSGVTSVTFGKRGAPHVTVGNNGARAGASLPGTGLSYETRLDRPVRSSKTSPSRRASAGIKPNGTRVENISETAAYTQPAPVQQTDTRVTHAAVVSSTAASNAGQATPTPTGNGGAGAGKGPGGGGRRARRSKKRRWGRRILKVLAFIAVFIIGFAVGQTPVDPTATSQYRDLQQQLISEQSKNKGIQSQLDDLTKRVGDLDALQKQLDEQKSEQEKTQQDLEEKQSELDEREKNIAQREQEKQQREQEAIQAAQQQAQQKQAQSQQTQQSQSSQQSGSSTSQQSSGGGVLVAVCKDGTRSQSAPGAPNYRGMCSGHGGISQRLGRQ